MEMVSLTPIDQEFFICCIIPLLYFNILITLIFPETESKTLSVDVINGDETFFGCQMILKISKVKILNTTHKSLAISDIFRDSSVWYDLRCHFKVEHVGTVPNTNLSGTFCTIRIIILKDSLLQRPK